MDKDYHAVTLAEESIKEYKSLSVNFEYTKHKNILTVYGHYRQHSLGVNETVIVSELCAGNLNDLLPELDEHSIIDYLKQIIRGLKAIAKVGVSHGDIKPENILYKIIGHKYELVIADFGLANNTVLGGTPMFMSPEGLYQRVTEKSDVYSRVSPMCLNSVKIVPLLDD